MPPHGVYLLLGPDRSRKLQWIHELERRLTIHPLDRHHLDLADASITELLTLARQQPAMSPWRLIIVDQAHRLDQAGIALLLKQAEAMTSMARVVLVTERELNNRQALAQAAASPSIIVEQFASAASGPSASPFALTDALGQRRAAGALSAAQAQLASGKDPLELLGLVAWQLTRWMAVRRLTAMGCTAEQTASATGLQPWHAQRVLSEVSRRSVASLRELLERCWRLDTDAKHGRIDPRLALEQLLVEICAAP